MIKNIHAKNIGESLSSRKQLTPTGKSEKSRTGWQLIFRENVQPSSPFALVFHLLCRSIFRANKFGLFEHPVTVFKNLGHIAKVQLGKGERERERDLPEGNFVMLSFSASPCCCSAASGSAAALLLSCLSRRTPSASTFFNPVRRRRTALRVNMSGAAAVTRGGYVDL